MPFWPTNNSKNQNFEKIKKHHKISSFHTGVPKIMNRCYTIPKIWHMTDVIFILHFGICFALLHPYQLKKSKLKNWKKSLGVIIILHMCTKFMITWCMFPEIWCATDRHTDRQKKWHITEVGDPPKNASTILQSTSIQGWWTQSFDILGKQPAESKIVIVSTKYQSLAVYRLAKILPT